MNISFKKFTQVYFPEYSSWFQDPELNSQLGPMDEDWLHWVLTEDEADGITWAVFDDDEMVGVVETAFDSEGRLPVVIRGIAVKPSRRRQGIGSAILHCLFAMLTPRGIFDYCAYIKTNNSASRRLFEKLGFISISLQPDKNGFLEYKRMGETAS